jgi:predicted Zn-ribbon and HTH transcriptional regulator
MLTKRQEIIELLKGSTHTTQEISSKLHLSIRDVQEHLKHVRKSIRAPQRFLIVPAECLGCGFVFKERSKIHSPGKCPRCRNTHIQEPLYHIE